MRLTLTSKRKGHREFTIDNVKDYTFKKVKDHLHICIDAGTHTHNFNLEYYTYEVEDEV